MKGQLYDTFPGILILLYLWAAYNNTDAITLRTVNADCGGKKLHHKVILEHWEQKVVANDQVATGTHGVGASIIKK